MNRTTASLTAVTVAALIVAVNPFPLFGGSPDASVERASISSPKKLRRLGWYLRTVVEAVGPDGTRYLHRSAGVFGELKNARNTKDRYDIPAVGSAILQVVFPHADWGENAGDYFSDYHHLRPGRKRRVWTFQVRNDREVDLSNADLTISLEGPYTVYHGKNGLTERANRISRKRHITLVDVDNGETYRFRTNRRSVTLSMDGKHIRTFRWVLGPVARRDFDPPAEAATMYQNSSAPKAASVTSLRRSRGFGEPPEFR